MPSPMSGTPPRRSPISPIVPSNPAPASWRFTKTPPSAAMVLRTTTPAMIARVTTVSATASATIWRARRGAKSEYQLMRSAWCMGYGCQDAARTRSRKRSWKRCSRVISGWNEVPIRLPCSTATTRPSSSAASTVASGPTDSTIGARMNTACTAGSPSCGMSRSVSNESFWLPKALRRTATSSPPKLCCPSMASSTESASRINPAHVPYTGMPPAMRLRRGSATPKERLSLSITLDSPPGITSPATVSSSSGRRTVTASAPSSCSTARCSRTSPCSARTPTLGALPATLGETVRRREVGHVDADHGLAQPARGIRDDARVVEERRGFHDRGGALRGLPRLEDAGSDEYAVRPELHHERRIRGRRDATRGEQHHRQLAGLGDLGHELVRGLQLLGGHVELVLGLGAQRVDLTGNGADVLGRLRHVARARLALRADHRGALGDAPQRLAQVGRAADEGSGETPFVDVVHIVGRREHLRLVDVVDAERLEHLRLDEVPDARLRHDRDRDRGDDVVDEVGVAHARHAALRADVGGNALERHDGDGARVFRDARLLGGDDVHDHPALEHLGEAALDAVGAQGRGGGFGCGGGHAPNSIPRRMPPAAVPFGLSHPSGGGMIERDRKSGG